VLEPIKAFCSDLHAGLEPVGAKVRIYTRDSNMYGSVAEHVI